MTTKTTTRKTMYDQIQAELDRLTGGHVVIAEHSADCATVEIVDEQGGGSYRGPAAYAALVELESEGDDSRDALWSALEAASV